MILYGGRLNTAAFTIYFLEIGQDAWHVAPTSAPSSVFGQIWTECAEADGGKHKHTHMVGKYIPAT